MEVVIDYHHTEDQTQALVCYDVCVFDTVMWVGTMSGSFFHLASACIPYSDCMEM